MLASRRLLIGERESARQGWTGGIFQWRCWSERGSPGNLAFTPPIPAQPPAILHSPPPTLARPACNPGGFIVSHMQPAPAPPAFKPSGTPS